MIEVLATLIVFLLVLFIVGKIIEAVGGSIGGAIGVLVVVVKPFFWDGNGNRRTSGETQRLIMAAFFVVGCVAIIGYAWIYAPELVNR